MARVVTPALQCSLGTSQRANVQPIRVGVGAVKCDGMSGSNCKVLNLSFTLEVDSGLRFYMALGSRDTTASFCVWFSQGSSCQKHFGCIWFGKCFLFSLLIAKMSICFQSVFCFQRFVLKNQMHPS